VAGEHGTSDLPLISVGVPVRNGIPGSSTNSLPYLPESFFEWEVTLADNGSRARHARVK
jgi:hypothetical protein